MGHVVWEVRTEHGGAFRAHLRLAPAVNGALPSSVFTRDALIGERRAVALPATLVEMNGSKSSIHVNGCAVDCG